MDWMDAFPHKYGRVLHTQALQHAVHKFIGNDKAAEHMKNVMNGRIEKYLSLYDPKLGFYYPWCWKDHDGDKEHEEWFDSCANVLAILTGLATPAIAKNILKHIEKEKINEPFALKAIWPPIKPGDPEWKSYFEKCDARDPLSYLNGGIWPFIGGLYIGALVKMKEYAKAGKELEKLAKGDLQIIDLPHPPQYLEDGAKKHKMKVEDLVQLRKKEFNEWLHGADGTPRGEPYQAWTAGTYIYGYECLKQKKALFF